MSTVQVLIVDDEPLARERLKLLLQEESDSFVVAECRNGVEALVCLRQKSFDLVLLDIQMPGMSGLEMLRELDTAQLPPVIFVTAFQEHALEAFEVAAVDYLTKPVTRERLARALARVQSLREGAEALRRQDGLRKLLGGWDTQPEPRPKFLDRLLVRDGEKDLLIRSEEISWIEACDYYSTVHVGGRSLLIRESMQSLAERLDDSVFVRVHRSAIVNVQHVKALYREGRAEGTVLLRDGSHVRTSRTGRERLAAVCTQL